MLKTIMLVFFIKTNGFNNVVNLNNKEVTSMSSNIIGRKVKNLLKVKNIKKSALSKNSDFSKTKVTKASKTDFVTFKTRVTFT